MGERKPFKVKKSFAFLPPLAWVLFLDGIDLVGNVFTGILAFIGIGIALDAFIDLIQALAGVVIFENPMDAILPGGADLILPPVFDALPTFTAYYLYRRHFDG